VQIEKGRFGDTPLDGLCFGFLASWPGPIHLGNGTFQAVVDERADGRQRAALEAVAHGRETDPGSLVLQVFSTTVSKVLPTMFKTIDLKIDVTGRTASLKIPGVLEASASSILNPVTGVPHRVSIKLPAGFEYSETEVVSGKARALGRIKLEFNDTHAHLSRIHWSTHGVVRWRGRIPRRTALKRDRLLTAGALGLAVLLSWAWIVPMARTCTSYDRAAA
jgi:hypothetical protein